MAEEFVIRIDTGQGRGRAGTGTQPQSGAGAAAGALASVAAGRGSSMIGSALKRHDALAHDERLDRKTIQQIEEEQRATFMGSKLRAGLTMRDVQFKNEDGSIGTTRQMTAFGVGVYGTGSFLARHQGKIMATGAGIATKAAHSQLQYRSYTSGDTYQNQRDGNIMRAGGYGLAIAASGLNPAVFGAMVINEGVNLNNGRRLYNFDRAMETVQINNAKTIAGDISYGRRHGVR